MSAKFKEQFKDATEIEREDIRVFCQRPGKVDKSGNIVYFTEQAHKDQCDVNKIIAKYDRDGIITHVSKFEAKFGDMTGIEFKAAQDRILAAQQMFNDLPAEIRGRFDNSPHKLLGFMDNEANRDEAIKLGIIRDIWTNDTDGMGEHVPDGGNVNKPGTEAKPPPQVEN